MAMPVKRPVDYQPTPSSTADQASKKNSPHDSASLVPKTGFDEIPPELLFEIMKWISLSEGEESSVMSLACTSRRFGAALQEFRANPWLHENTRSGRLHGFTTSWLRWYLNSFKFYTMSLMYGTFDQLKQQLGQAATWTRDIRQETERFELSLGRLFSTVIAGTDWVDLFRSYQGHTMSVVVSNDGAPTSVLRQLEKALPSAVALHVCCHHHDEKSWDPELARLVADLCAGGRPLSLEFKFSWVEPIRYPLLRKVLMDALCGQGYVMKLSFDSVEKVFIEALLLDLTKHCNALRNVQLIQLGSVKDLSADIVDGLALALDKRRAMGGSRVSVVLNTDYDTQVQPDTQGASSAERIATLGSVGLYFGALGRETRSKDLPGRLADAMGRGPIDLSRKKLRPIVVELEPENDSPTASDSDDDVSGNKSATEVGTAVRASPARAGRTEASGEPRLKKRDKCVTS